MGKPAKPTAAALVKQAKVKRELIHRLFNSPDGEKVYNDLMDRFYHNAHSETDETKLSRHAGRRDVMLFLRAIVEKNNE